MQIVFDLVADLVLELLDFDTCFLSLESYMLLGRLELVVL